MNVGGERDGVRQDSYWGGEKEGVDGGGGGGGRL